MKKIITLVIILATSPAWAQNAAPASNQLWSVDYTKQQKAQPRQMIVPPSVVRAPSPLRTVTAAPPAGRYTYGSPFATREPLTHAGNGAFERQWQPVQQIFGVSSGQAKSFLRNVQQGYTVESKKFLASAQDWAVIFGESGLPSTLSDAAGDWFNYVATDIPTAFIGNGKDPRIGAPEQFTQAIPNTIAPAGAYGIGE